MRQLTYHGRRRLSVDLVAPRALEPGELRVDVDSAGLCKSDVYGYSGVNDRRDAALRPGDVLVMGHEASGVVSELGPGVAGPAVGTPGGRRPDLRVRPVRPVPGLGRAPLRRADRARLCSLGSWWIRRFDGRSGAQRRGAELRHAAGAGRSGRAADGRCAWRAPGRADAVELGAGHRRRDHRTRRRARRAAAHRWSGAGAQLLAERRSLCTRLGLDAAPPRGAGRRSRLRHRLGLRGSSGRRSPPR